MTTTWTTQNESNVAYNNATAYTVGSVVNYNTTFYTCILNSTGNLPTNGTYWKLTWSTQTKTT